MQIFLLWQRGSERSRALDPQRVAARLQKIFGPLFKQPPRARILQNEATAAVYLELPVLGWKPAYFQEDEQTWALSLDYPIDGREALASLGQAAPPAERVLPALCRQMERDPFPLLREMSPPFGLVWSAKPGQRTLVQNDGLGFAQFFEYEAAGGWAISNKIFAFKALGLPVELDAEQWATRCTLGWFPLRLTGYRNIATLEPGTQLTITPVGVSRRRVDVLADWLNHDGLAEADCLELARSSVQKYVRAASPLWSQASAGLTGGFDSRAVVSTLLAEAAPHCFLRVRGHHGAYDVMIAEQLAKTAGVPLKVQTALALPPANAGRLLGVITHAARWQAGLMEFKGHKTMLAKDARLGGGDVNIMGQHGEIGRGFYASRINARALAPAEHEATLIRYVTQYTRPYLRPQFRDAAIASIEQAYHQADRYNLEGDDRLDFFYLYERTRRWAPGGNYSQPGKVIAPFLNPGYIRAAYGLVPEMRVNNPFHRHIVQQHQPDWTAIPYLDELALNYRKKKKRKEQKLPKWRKTVRAVTRNLRELVTPTPPYQSKGVRTYNNQIYWQTVGKPLIEEILRTDGLWRELFDPAIVREQWWLLGPDDLAVFHALEQIAAERVD